MSDPVVIQSEPIVSTLTPYVVAIASAVISYIAKLALDQFTRWTSAKISAGYAAAIEAAAANEAGKLVAGALGNLATAQVSIRSPGIAAAANSIVNASAPLLKRAVTETGLTPELAASIVVGEIGKLQAQMTSAAPTKTAAAVVPAPTK
jgi:hypothetical protein